MDVQRDVEEEEELLVVLTSIHETQDREINRCVYLGTGMYLTFLEFRSVTSR